MSRRTAEDPEQGQIMVLVIGYLLLSLLLVSVVVAASGVYLEHKKLLALADGAAVAAADSFTLGQVQSSGGAPVAALSAERVRSTVAGYVQKYGAAARFDGLAVGQGTGTPDGRTAQVELSAVAHPPLVNFLVPDGIPITAVSVARSRLTR
nr:pilus assembly protein TadG-related protein [Paenarthrobacter sp. DKR-5]